MGKRIVTLLIAMVIIALTVAPALANEEDYPATVVGGALHLRQKPDKKAHSLGRFKSGTQVFVLADGDDYCRVRTKDGKEGYMMKEFLSFENGLPPKEVLTPEPEPTPDPTREQALSRGIDPNKPMLALTFDDGPQPDSLIVLEALNKHGARGTFFIQGMNIAGNEEVLKKIIASGHQVGSHSWSHPNFRNVSESTVRSQMERTAQKVKDVAGYELTIMRPPYGANNRLSRRVLRSMGLPIILWSVDSLDWKTRSTSATVNTILEQATDGAIILCHDVWNTTGRAMEEVIPKLIERGFQLVTVSEMMSFRKEALHPGTEYNHLDRKNIEPGLSPSPAGTPAPAGARR
ncbi:MAG: polysaccharide deacetylase family protein [Clostridiales bacterium]|nr:polysaccharide deacetylase family protein [Clostridiales bacterium]